MLAWQLSNTLDGIFCLDALRQALGKGRPNIFNTDQGAQFTADAFTTALLAANIQVSMDGRGRALDNVFCERLWRSVKYENSYLNQYDTVRQLQAGLSDDFDFYNHERPHQRPDYLTPPVAEQSRSHPSRRTLFSPFRCQVTGANHPAPDRPSHLRQPHNPGSSHTPPPWPSNRLILLNKAHHSTRPRKLSPSPKSDKSKFSPLPPTPSPLSPAVQKQKT